MKNILISKKKKMKIKLMNRLGIGMNLYNFIETRKNILVSFLILSQKLGMVYIFDITE